MPLFVKAKSLGKSGLRSLRRSFLFLEKQSHEKPRWVFAIVIIITLFSLSQAAKVHGVLSIYELLPSSFPSLADLKKTEKSFNDGRSLILNVSSQKSMSEADLCLVRGWISMEVLNNTKLTKVFSPFDLRAPRIDGSKIFYPRQIELDCEKPSTSKMISLSQFANTPWDGVLVDTKKNSFLIQFDFNESAVDPKLRAFSYSVLQEFTGRWDHDIAAPLGLQTQVLGSAAYESYLGKGNKDFSRVLLLLIFVLLVFFRIFMGTWRAGFLYLISLMIALVWVIGLMGLLGGSFDILTNALMVMISVATLQDLAFVAMDQMKGMSSSRKSFRRLQFAGFFTSLTTIVGFGSLAISSLPMIRDFGIWAAAGALFEWILTFFFLPLLTRPGYFFEKWVSYEKAFAYQWVLKIKSFSNSPFLKFHFISFFVLFLPCGLHFYDEPKLMFPSTHIFRQDSESFVSQMGWEYSVSLVFTDAAVDKKELLQRAMQSPYVQRIDTATATFSSTTQNLTPLDRALAEREFFKMWRPERYFGAGDLERYHLFLKTSEISHVLKLRDEIHAFCKEHCYVSGSIVTYAEFVRRLAQTLFESLFVGLVLVSLILWVLAHVLDFSRPSLVIYCALWGPAILLILIMVFRVPINMMTSLTASVVLALTGDNIIEFLFAKKAKKFEQGMEMRFSGALVTTLMMSGACLVFLASPFDPPRTLGVLFCLGFLLSFIGDYFVFRYLWKKKVS